MLLEFCLRWLVRIGWVFKRVLKVFDSVLILIILCSWIVMEVKILYCVKIFLLCDSFWIIDLGNILIFLICYGILG